MAFSIESIRNLNKIHLLAMNIDQKENRILDTNPWQPSPGTPWRVSMYGGASIGIGGNIEYDNPLGNIVKSLTNNALVRTAATLGTWAGGIAPDIDINRKFMYAGVGNLSFHARGILVLENDIVEDYFVPIEKLTYLAFPDRGDALELGKKIKEVSDSLKNWLKKDFGVDYSFTNSVGAAVNSIANFFKLEGATSDDSKGFELLEKKITSLTGTAYTMKIPPTFDPTKAGSGLDFRYGGILISDVFIKSLKFDIPKLYYQGGYPAVINVDMDLETMRPITATAITKIMMTQTQAWEEEKSDSERAK